ncbi:MAG: T9SS type A sorting domain-containing protein [Candidatus Neomarinimicrobiota bacterium]|nr:T9SS type A sorting domain-containing protein [Candidatus Neomarinimicrobiota bacterium]
MGVLDIECEEILSIEKDVLPLQFVLYQNYPNPFNLVTTLRYNFPEDAMVNLTIYDMMGRQVSTLVSSEQSAGYKSVQWNAVNDTGAPVSAGLYLYRIRTGKFVKTLKMVLLK